MIGVCLKMQELKGQITTSMMKMMIKDGISRTYWTVRLILALTKKPILRLPTKYLLESLSINGEHPSDCDLEVGKCKTNPNFGVP